MPPQLIEIGFRFFITVSYKDKECRYTVVKCWETQQVEHFILIANNGVLLFQSDRPAVRSSNKDTGKFKIKLIFGQPKTWQFAELVARKIEQVVKEHEQYMPGYTDPKNFYNPETPEKY